MGFPETLSTSQMESAGKRANSHALVSIQHPVHYAPYVLALAVSVSLWFTAIRAPLWLDETGSFWQISKGFWQIPSRQGGLSFPAYSYILWFATKILGTSEIALRIPEILAMLAAVYLLYRAARELFSRDVAIITAVIFSIHPVVIFASIDVRPYAFAVLSANAAIFILVRLRQNHSAWLAALFGITAAVTVYFHFLFVLLLPALAICFVAVGDHKRFWQQFSAALGAFALAFLPVVPGLLYAFRTRATHVWEEAPKLAELGSTLAPGWLMFILGGTVLAAAATRRFDLESRVEIWRILFCSLLGLVPILILYGISAGTSIHIFVAQHRLVAIPGIALCWGVILSRIDSRTLRLLFCVAVVAASAYQHFSSPWSSHHGRSWKYALEFTEENTSADQAPVLICSDFTESNHQPMPTEFPKDSNLFAPLTYYRLSAPVVPLPMALNEEAVRVASAFLQDPSRRHQRFLALGFRDSYSILDWLAFQASASHSVRVLGEFEGYAVLEFTPRSRQHVF